MLHGRNLSKSDDLLISLDQALRTVFGRPVTTGRPNPAAGMTDAHLADGERRISMGLMRVNHAGEVAAQGLYQGQALTARLPAVREGMERAAQEENDHLAWCEERVQDFGGRTSFLGPAWYAGAFLIGAVAGAAGDKWSLGFVVETEKQVGDHLEGHLSLLPEEDGKSRAIVNQMKVDEAHHATVALEGGAAALPTPIRRLMKLTSRVMTTLAYRV